jgi:hypothetical protein
VPRIPELPRAGELLAEIPRLKRLSLTPSQESRLDAICLRYERGLQWKEISHWSGLSVEAAKVCLREAVRWGADYAVTGNSLRHGRRKGYHGERYPLRSTYEELLFWKHIKESHGESIPTIKAWAHRQLGAQLDDQFIYHYRRKHGSMESAPAICQAVDYFDTVPPEFHFLWTRTDIGVWREIIGYFAMNWIDSRAYLCSLLIKNGFSGKKWVRASFDWKRQMTGRGVCYLSVVLDLCSQAIGDDAACSVWSTFGRIQEIAEPGKMAVLNVKGLSRSSFWKIAAVYQDKRSAVVLVPYRNAPSRCTYLLGRFLVRNGTGMPELAGSETEFIKLVSRSISNFEKREDTHTELKPDPGSHVVVVGDDEDFVQHCRGAKGLKGIHSARCRALEPSNHFSRLVGALKSARMERK